MKPQHFTTQPSLTYTITFRHQEDNRTTSLEIRHLSKKEINDVLITYGDMYRSIEVICDQTGEVVLTQYFSLEFWG
jgi:hypothetical protein